MDSEKSDFVKLRSLIRILRFETDRAHQPERGAETARTDPMNASHAATFDPLTDTAENSIDLTYPRFTTPFSSSAFEMLRQSRKFVPSCLE